MTGHTTPQAVVRRWHEDDGVLSAGLPLDRVETARQHRATMSEHRGVKYAGCPASGSRQSACRARTGRVLPRRYCRGYDRFLGAASAAVTKISSAVASVGSGPPAFRSRDAAGAQPVPALPEAPASPDCSARLIAPAAFRQIVTIFDVPGPNATQAAGDDR